MFTQHKKEMDDLLNKILNSLNKPVDDYTKIIKSNPDSADAYFNRGLAYHKIAMRKEQLGGSFVRKAIQDFSRAIKLRPEDSNAYFSRGLSYSKLGEYQKAVDDFTRAIKLNPKCAETYTYYLHRGCA